MVSVAKVLEESKPKIMDQSDYWIADITKAQINYEISNYILIAKSYDFQIPTSGINEFMQAFIMAFTMLLAEWYTFNH